MNAKVYLAFWMFNVSFMNKVVKVDEAQGGMIPMSNGMVEQAAASAKGTCLDDTGNAVCQIYKITIDNDSSAGQFVDGYVSLKGIQNKSMVGINKAIDKE